MNGKAFSLFGSFPNYINNTTSSFRQDLQDVQIDIRISGTNHNYPDDANRNTDTLYIETTQDFVGLYAWNPFKKIVITTGTLPVQSEFTKGSGDATRKILTDFSPSNDITDQRSVYQYFPRAQYRLVDLLTDSPIRQIDFKVWWEDIDGKLTLIKIPWNSELNMKFAFIKKTMFDNDV